MSDKYTLHLGDCIDVMRTMPDASIDLTVTSPPYDNLRTYGEGFDAATFDWRTIIAELHRLTKPGGVVVWVVADATIKGSETGTSFRQALWAMECGFNLHDTMIYQQAGTGAKGSNYAYWQAFEYMFVWSKGRPAAVNRLQDKPNVKAGTKQWKSKGGRSVNKYGNKSNAILQIEDYGIRQNIWRYASGNANGDDTTAHPAPFPEPLARDHIISWSNEGNTVFDPMMGSGTTGKMAVTTGRRFVGVELEPDYFAIAQERIEKATWQLSMFDMIAAD